MLMLNHPSLKLSVENEDANSSLCTHTHMHNRIVFILKLLSAWGRDCSLLFITFSKEYPLAPQQKGTITAHNVAAHFCNVIIVTIRIVLFSCIGREFLFSKGYAKEFIAVNQSSIVILYEPASFVMPSKELKISSGPDSPLIYNYVNQEKTKWSPFTEINEALGYGYNYLQIQVEFRQKKNEDA